MVFYLSSDDEKPSREKRDVAAVKRLDNIDNSDGVSRAAAKGGPGICEYRYQNVLLHVEWTRVERKSSRPEPG